MVFVINWTIGMGTSTEKIHYFLQIYSTSRNTLKFTWLLIIHRWGICPVCVSQKLVKSDVILVVITAPSFSGHMPQVQVKSRSLFALYRVLIIAVLDCFYHSCKYCKRMQNFDVSNLRTTFVVLVGGRSLLPPTSTTLVVVYSHRFNTF